MSELLEANLIERVAIGDLLRKRARDSASVEAFIDYGSGRREVWTYAALNARVNQCVRGLRSLGLAQGQRIGLVCGNGVDFATCLWAGFKGGFVLVPINYAQSADDVAWTLNHAGISALIIDELLWPGFAAADAQLPAALPRISAGRGPAPAGMREARTLLSLLEGQSAAEIEDVLIDDRDVAQIMYTSGTTSKPKGVMTSQKALMFAAFSNVIGYGYQRPYSTLSVLPMFHIAAEVGYLMTTLLGGRFVCLRGFDAARVVELMAAERVANFVGLPMMWRALLAVPGVAGHDWSALQRCTYAMATMDPETLDRLRSTFGCAFDLPGGQTEFTPCPTIHQDGTPTENPGANCWGTPTAVTDQAVLDDDGRELPPGEIGEICWRGPMAMSGYYRNEAATAEARKFGWHHSGDLGFIDACGQLQFVDRKKDMIKSGGENVASAQVEEVLLGQGGIAIAAAIGLPHPHWGEAVCAVVQAKPGVALDEASLLEHCRARLGSFQRPKRVLILDQLPMTATGKIRKAELRQQYAKLFEAEGSTPPVAVLAE